MWNADFFFSILQMMAEIDKLYWTNMYENMTKKYMKEISAKVLSIEM